MPCNSLVRNLSGHPPPPPATTQNCRRYLGKPPHSQGDLLAVRLRWAGERQSRRVRSDTVDNNGVEITNKIHLMFLMYRETEKY